MARLSPHEMLPTKRAFNRINEENSYEPCPVLATVERPSICLPPNTATAL